MNSSTVLDNDLINHSISFKSRGKHHLRPTKNDKAKEWSRMKCFQNTTALVLLAVISIMPKQPINIHAGSQIRVRQECDGPTKRPKTRKAKQNVSYKDTHTHKIQAVPENMQNCERSLRWVPSDDSCKNNEEAVSPFQINRMKAAAKAQCHARSLSLTPHTVKGSY